jgi:hypothetical protein
MGEHEWWSVGDEVHFDVDGFEGRVWLKPGGSRIRGQVVLAELGDARDQAVKWMNRQDPPLSAVLEVAELDEGPVLRLVFERSVGRVSDDDLLFDEAAEYAKAWTARSDVPSREVASFGGTDLGDPVALPPENAWLMLGDEASYPSRTATLDAYEDGLSGVYETCWTAAKQTKVGDLLLFYFTAPRKTVSFAARAASSAFFDPTIGVNAHGEVRDEQWWCWTTPLVAVDPISLSVLNEASGGGLILRGRSGRYLRPEFIDALALTALDEEMRDELADIAVTPHGSPHLPAPSSTSLTELRTLAAGALALEATVERHVVEPLLRIALAKDARATFKPQQRIDRRLADYVVEYNDLPSCVIEVKLAVRATAGAPWSTSPDFQQLRWYADKLGTNGVLIDAHRIHLVHRGASEPFVTIERDSLSDSDIAVLRSHLLGTDD